MRIGWITGSKSISSASFRLRVAMIMTGLRELGHECGFYSERENYDAVIVSKRYDDETLATMNKVKEKGGGGLIFDLCDNHFFSDSEDPIEIKKHVKKVSRLKRAISLADYVTTSSKYLSKVVHEQCGVEVNNINTIDDCIEMDNNRTFIYKIFGLVAEIRFRIFEINLNKVNQKRERFVWFGTHGVSYAQGGMNDILERKAEISRALGEGNATVTIISNSKRKYKEVSSALGVRTFYLPWNKYTISRALRLHTYLLLPIRPSPFTLSKSANRPVTAIYNGLKVICDMIPAYEKLRDFIVTPVSEENIRSALSMKPSVLIESMADSTEYVMDKYSQRKIAAQWEAVIKRMVTNKH